jgi:DNA-binding SARP family transcriptional activator
MAPERTTAGRSTLEAPTVRVRLLGGVELQIGDAPVPSLDSARAESVLAFLLLRRDAPQQRRHVAFKLWPDSPEPQALTNLRHVLHNLRRGLPDVERFIDVGPRTLQWRADAPLWLDVAAFEQAIADGRLEEAVEVYGGELVEGNYDEWLLEQRERLAQLHLDALERLAKTLEEQGRLADATRYAEQLLRQDSLREETYRLLMRLHDAAGNRARALRTYHACATTLVRELGVEPSAATRNAYEALLGTALDEEAPVAGPTSAPLIARQAERARLAELWRTAERGAARFALVTGEAGIGKSRLVEELRSWCAHGGATTAEARSYPIEGTMVYGVLVAWLRCPSIASRLRRLERADLTELARVLPEVLTEIPDLASPAPLPADEQRQRLFAAAGRAILSAGAPLLLIADDLQWCDIQTLQFVHYLLRTEPEARLLVAATARREEIDGDHPVSELVAAMQALGVVREIGLGRLDRGSTALLAERVLGERVTEAQADRLYDESEGNPLFLVEALHGEPETASALGGEMPEKVHAVIAARLGRLSEPAGRLVGVAATIGREFTAQVIADASDADEDVLVSGLDELWRRGVVRAHGPSAYDFSHGRIREAAYRALGPAHARHHHMRVGEALQRGHGADLDSVSGQIAAHYEAAGAIDEAIDWHVRAAEAAQRLHANRDAVHSLERALGLVGGVPAGAQRDSRELGLLTQLPVPLVAVEGYLSGRVTDVHERALALARALGVEPEPPLVRSLALATLTRGDFQGARPFGEQLRARAERDGDEVLWVESAYVLGVAAYWQGRLEDAREEFEVALQRYRPEHRLGHLLRYGQDPRVFCQMRLAHTLWLLGRGDDAERARDEALASATQAGHPYSRAGALVFAVLLALDQGDEDRFCQYANELRSDQSALEARQTRSGAEAFAAFTDLLDGRTEGGVQRARLAIADARHEGPAAPGHAGFLMRVLVEALARAGNAEAGLAAADEALEMGGGAQLWEAEIRRLRASFLEALGAAPAEVEAELVRAIEIAQQQRARPFEARARESLDRLRTGMT